MQSIKDYISFTQYIEMDAKKVDINPVRFINVESMQMWVRVKSFLTGNVDATVKLSEFCENDDIAPNLTRFKKRLRTINENTLVIPLSEYLRINRPIASRTITDVLHTNFENIFGGKIRVYILLYRMKDVLSSIHLDPRETNAFLSIAEKSEIDYSLTIIQKNLDFKIKGNDIEGFKKYLIYWEQNPDKPIILRTNNAINYSDIVFSDNVEVIVTAFDLLRYFGLTPMLQKKLGTDEQWESLLFEYSKSPNIDLALGTILQIPGYNDDLFAKWNSYNKLERWLLWIWARVNSTNAYICHVFSKTSSFEDFETAVYSGIADFLDSKNYTEMYILRKRVILKLNLPFDEKRLNFCMEFDPVKKMKCLTDTAQEERIEIIKIIARITMSMDFMQLLKTIYPLAYAYLQSYYTAEASITAYFDEYKSCKMSNKATPDLLSLVDQFAQEHCKTILQLKSRNHLIEQVYNDNSTILFVDALGAEYASALESMFGGEAYDVNIGFGYCNMPSITEYNNDFYKDRNHLPPYYGLDKWKHSSCEYPYSIEHELELLKDIKTQVDKALNSNDAVIISTDHGSSRLAVVAKGNSHDTSDSAKKYKYGRYCIDEQTDYSKLAGCISRDGFWIFANYDKFKQSGAPACEIHGGASLEEMIVPVICVRKRDNIANPLGVQPIEAKLVLLNSEIKMPVSKDIEVCFTCNIELHNSQAHVEGKVLDCTFDNGVYSFIHHVDTEKSEYTAKIILQSKIVGELKYIITRPMQQRKDFDI